MAQVYTKKSEVKEHLSDISSANMPYPKKMFMVRPTYFTVDYVINPHMEGNIGNVDRDLAMQQWTDLRNAFSESGMKVAELEGQENLPDMVFCANQSLPFIDEEGNRKVMMSIMNSKHRKAEVSHVEKFYKDSGYEISYPDSDKVSDFEGMGDAIWHRGKKLLWGGYGFRTSLNVYKDIAEKWDVPVLACKLEHPEFYHLDTCLCILNEETALIYPKAFDEEGLGMLRTVFSEIIEADEYEAEKLFACNATCPDGKNVMIQKGCDKVNAALIDKGFNVHELDTSEFLKSGGSVFCMKMIYW